MKHSTTSEFTENAVPLPRKIVQDDHEPGREPGGGNPTSTTS